MSQKDHTVVMGRRSTATDQLGVLERDSNGTAQWHLWILIQELESHSRSMLLCDAFQIQFKTEKNEKLTFFPHTATGIWTRCGDKLLI